MNELLASVRKRPGVYFGNGDQRFANLLGFLQGHSCGFVAAGGAAQDPRSMLTPIDFHRFVTEYYGLNFPDGGRGWQTFVYEHSVSEQEAFELFFKLIEEYERLHQKGPDSGAIPPSPTPNAAPPSKSASAP
jgi:hypothetical protein